MAESENPYIFIQFAGQGVKYMDELRRLYNMSPSIQPFIQDCITEIKKQAAQYDDSRSCFFEQGLNADEWIEKPEATPDGGYLMSSPLSHPFIYLSQIANYVSVLQEGIDPALLLKHTHSATGFSTGVVAAVLVSMGKDLDTLMKHALKVQAMFFWQGVRCQQSILRFGVRARLDEQQMNSSEGNPSCMASINNMPYDSLMNQIHLFSDYGTVHPAYELLPDRWIVAGLPEALSAFNMFLKMKIQDLEFRFIPSTIAAHCPFLNYALETSPEDARKVGLNLVKEAMSIPVWSNDGGKDLSRSESIVYEIMRAYFTRPAYWKDQILPLRSDSGIKYVLDFGPGPGVASLTENLVSGSDIQVIRCTVPLGRKRLFSEIVPSLH